MVDKEGKKDDINKYSNLDKISVELPDEYLTDKNLYKSKTESELPTKIKVGKDRVVSKEPTPSSKEENEEKEEKEDIETFEQFTNNNNKNSGNTNTAGKAKELFNCNKFMYITTAVFVLLLLVLLILKYKK